MAARALAVPSGSTPVRRLRLLAVDVETTGLDPGRDAILAVGMVPVDGSRIELAGARRLVVRQGDVGPTVGVHRLTHDVLAGGRPLPEVLDEVCDALDGRVLLAHHCALEERFLSAAARRTWGSEPDLHGVDTLALHRRILAPGQHELPPGSLRLWAARRRFGLPEVPAHDALSDALACAELYLAQVAELGEHRHLTLDDLRRRPRRSWRGRLGLSGSE